MGSTEVFAGAFIAMLATSLGAALVLFIKKIDCHLYSFMLAFAAGIMFFSAWEMANESLLSTVPEIVGLGVAVGIAFIALLERFIPHLHMIIRKKEITTSKKKATLLVGTITLHNVPEGLAIASAFAASGPLGWLVAGAIALQDIPEGFMISAPLSCYGMKSSRAVEMGVFSGLAEFAAAVIGFFFLSTFAFLIPFGLSFSAGAMLYLVFVELMPDAMGNKNERNAIASFIAGAGIAFGLATLLGF
ncbi:MAG: ZIP family metal transporter [Candidatus Bilamarchaeaceae archaeon]